MNSASNPSAAGQPQQENAPLNRRNWLRRHPIKSASIIVLLIILGPYVFSRLTSSHNCLIIVDDPKLANPRNSTGPNKRISLLVMNIAHGRGNEDSNWAEGGQQKRNRISSIAELIRSCDCDIVVLNEVDFNATWSGHQNQAAAIATSANYRYRLEQRNLDFRFAYGSFSFGNAILSRLPITNSSYVELPGFSAWEEFLAGKKKGAVATINDSQSEFQIVPIHLEHRDEDTRVNSIKKFLSLQTDLPLLLAGDFNSTPSGFPGSSKGKITKENTIDHLISDGRLTTHNTTTPSDQEFTFPSDRPYKTIDWVFASHHFKIINYQVIDSAPRLSDHLTILIEFELETSHQQ
ncbi:MAG: endonuclease/exonuclease/phosphatase family protein [Planctomycetota bacterium]